LSLYKSLNYGIKKASGKIITFLHSDDIFNSPTTIELVIKKINKSSKKIFFGDVVYFSNDFKNIFRYYSAKNFSKESMKYGNMPPHTGSYYYKDIFDKYGYYKDFKIAGDFEHLFRILYKEKKKFENLNLITTRMKSGGLSNRNFKSYLIVNKELIKALIVNGFYSNFFLIHFRIPYKILQYIKISKKKINKNFKYMKSNFFKKFYCNNLNLITNIKNLNYNKNFYLSALNLAFLGSFSKGLINYDKNMINWGDGVFAKFLYKIKKTPGREILENLKLPNFIERVIVIGNLTPKGADYLKNRFKKKILNVKLPYGNIDTIKKKIFFKLKKNDIVFLTLPTPKQEQLAKYLSIINNYFKIICIGGSINIASNEEKPVPKALINYEFVWRLRYETRRRLIRLIQTFFNVAFDRIFFKKIVNIKIKKI